MTEIPVLERALYIILPIVGILVIFYFLIIPLIKSAFFAFTTKEIGFEESRAKFSSTFADQFSFLNFFAVAQEKAKLSIAMNRIDRYVWTSRPNTVISSDDLKDKDQYEIKVQNNTGKRLTDINIEFQFPLIVVDSDILNKEKTSGVTFSPKRMTWKTTMTGNGGLVCTGNMFTSKYILSANEIQPTGSITVTVVMDKKYGLANKRMKNAKGLTDYILGNYFAAIDSTKVPKKIFAPLQISNELIMTLGKETEATPQLLTGFKQLGPMTIGTGGDQGSSTQVSGKP